MNSNSDVVGWGDWDNTRTPSPRRLERTVTPPPGDRLIELAVGSSIRDALRAITATTVPTPTRPQRAQATILEQISRTRAPTVPAITRQEISTGARTPAKTPETTIPGIGSWEQRQAENAKRINGGGLQTYINQRGAAGGLTTRTTVPMAPTKIKEPQSAWADYKDEVQNEGFFSATKNAVVSNAKSLWGKFFG